MEISALVWRPKINDENSLKCLAKTALQLKKVHQSHQKAIIPLIISENIPNHEMIQ